jgi:hypothetical protein
VRSNALLMAVLATAAFVASPAMAAKKTAKHTVSCKQIKEAIAGGKSADEVAKDLKTTDAHVKSCTSPTAKHHGGKHAAAK